MKLLRIVAQGLPLFREELDIVFYAQQRVGEEDRETLFPLTAKPNVFLHTTNAFIGINASGKTSVLKVIQLALSILNNEPINHVETRSILGSTSKAVLRIYFYDAAQKTGSSVGETAEQCKVQEISDGFFRDRTVVCPEPKRDVFAR